MARETQTVGGAPNGVARPGWLYLPASMAVILAVFAIGALGWVRFYQSPDGGGGTPAGLFTHTDYPAIVIASRLVAEGRGADLYDLDVQREGQRRLASEGYILLPPDAPLSYPYPYAPFIAVLWSPLAGLSPLVGMALYDLLNIAAYAGGLWLLLSALPLSRVQRLLLLAAGLSSFPFIVNLEQGQSSGLVMLGLAGGIGLLRRGHDFPAGLALGVLLLKLQWLPLIGLVLLWKLRWRALGGLAVMGALLAGLTLITAGAGWVGDFTGILAKAQRFSADLLLTPSVSHSLSGQLYAIMGKGQEEPIRTVMLAATVLVAGLLLALWRETWLPATPRWDALMALTVLGALLTNLQVNTHDLCLLALPVALGLSFLYASGAGYNSRAMWYGLAWLAYLIPALILPQTFEMPARLTTLVMLAMFVLLVVTLEARRVRVARQTA